MPINKKAYRRYKVIDACLRNKMRPFPTIQELIDAIAEKLDIDTTVNTIQKDLAAMKLPQPDGFDAPIQFNRRKMGYEYTDPDFAISGVSLNSIDIDAIKEAIEIINAIGGSRVSEKFSHAVEKMLSSVREDLTPQDQERKIIQTDAVTDARGFEHFDLFFSACRERIPVNFTHYSYSKRKFQAITIHPVFLKEFENRWYVIGHSELHNQLRTFGFDRIYGPEALRKTFIETPAQLCGRYLNDVYGVFPLKDGEREQIVIHTNPLITNYFRAQKIHPSQHIEMNEYGDAVITFELIPSMELARLFMSYGNQLTVKEPKQFVEFIETYRS
jgi:predicted DNA-binding transcriptional regulator YafY